MTTKKPRKLKEMKNDNGGEYRRRIFVTTQEAEHLYELRSSGQKVDEKHRLLIKIPSLNREIRDLREKLLESETRSEVFKHIKPCKKFDLLNVKHYEGDGVTSGVPCLFLSDIHHGEVVDPSQINGVNEFNSEISKQRIQNVIDTSINLLFDHFANPKYDYIVLAMGGDMVSGNIHDELRETNDAKIIDISIDLANTLIQHIYTLKERFHRVYVPCVVGNHGRLDKRPRAKGGVTDNFDFLIYKIIERHFADDYNVTIDVSKGFDLRFDVNGHGFLLTHGNQFKAGNALAGPVMAWKRGELKKKKNYDSVGDPFDTMIMGHFHSLTYANGLIVNGTTKGMDEWTFGMNFEFEKPQQALWIVGNDGRINYKLEVFAD